MQKIVPHLWFDDQAEEAVNLYTSLFSNSKVVSTTYYPKATEEVSGRPAGSVMNIQFQLNGQDFLALNGGSTFTFNESISLFVNCESIEEADMLWDKLTSDGGEESMCGWLKDKFGVSWQIIPPGLHEVLQDPDPVKAEKATAAMLKMKKLDIAELKKATEEK